MQNVFFDIRSLKKGNYYKLVEGIVAKDDREYEIQDWIGRGGNSVVFSCFDKETEEEFAIKFLLNLKDKAFARFEREIDLLKSFDDPHISQYITDGSVEALHNKSANKTENIPFIVMELADSNLSELMKKHDHNIKEEEYLGQIRGLCKALKKIHEKAIHRDIKPENILVSGEKWVLSDFGLCSYVDSEDNEGDLSQNEQLIGPKFWLSPEAQNRKLGTGDELSEHSDVFQIGALFWYVINGRFPTGVVTEADWKGRSDLFPVIHKTLIHDHEQRTANGAELLSEFEAVVDVA